MTVDAKPDTRPGRLSANNIALARRMVADGKTIYAVAQHFGVADSSIRYHVDPTYNERTKTRSRRNRETPQTAVRRLMIAEGMHDIPVAVIAEREIAMLAPRSLTAETFGDPPRGRSALDKRNGAADYTAANPSPVSFQASSNISKKHNGGDVR